MTTPPITSITDELIAELDHAANLDSAIRITVRADYLRALLAERADLKQQLVAAGITAENCEIFRKDAERYQWLRDKHNDEYGDIWVSTWDSDAVAWVSLDAYFTPTYDGELDLDAAIDAAMRQ